MTYVGGPPVAAVDRLVTDAALRSAVIGDRTVALVTNDVATTTRFDRTLDALLGVGVRVTHVLAPEHGLHGTGQAGESEPDGVDECTGVPVVDTYGTTPDQLVDRIAGTGAELVVVDLVDVGARLWTYPWTMLDCLVAAARARVPVVVLDRPNPLGGLVAEGPALDPAFASFVGRLAVPLRHGLTMGELARIAVAAGHDGLGADTELDVVTVPDPEDRRPRHGSGQGWVAPSPNLPTLATAVVYPGTCLLEGTTLSEGRGTTRPFETLGAPWIDDRLLPAVRERELPGVRFREVRFRPMFHKHAGEVVRGLAVHVTDPAVFRPVLAAVTVLDVVARLHPRDFAVRPPSRDAGTAVPVHALDLLWGSDLLRTGLQAGDDVTALVGDEHPPEGTA